MEYRRNLLTREWVVYGPEIKSPEQLVEMAEPRIANGDLFRGGCNGGSDDRVTEGVPCPYCPEQLEADQTNIFSVNINSLSPGGFPRDMTLRDDEWHVRVVPAYRPVFRIETPLKRMSRRLHDVMEAPGAHEKIVLSPTHGEALWDLPARRIELIWHVLRHRMINLYRDPRLGHQYAYMVFGHHVGGLYAHSVLNLTASPFIPRKVRRELDGAHKWYDIKERCLLSDIYEEEIYKRDRGKPHGIIFESKNFIALIPFFAAHPFETWILPLDHFSDFTQTPVNCLPELARVSLRVIVALKHCLGPFPFTLALMNQPNEAWGVNRGYWKTLGRDWLWRLRIVPDLPVADSPYQAFNNGTGVRLNPVYPEDAAAFIRKSI